jgi:hypothetical protein
MQARMEELLEAVFSVLLRRSTRELDIIIKQTVKK